MDRAGFIEAPEIGPANNASKATTLPITIPAVIPCSFAPVETLIIVSMSIKVRIISKIKACSRPYAGSVAP